eukprot:482414-Rhodomonas_salina.2
MQGSGCDLRNGSCDPAVHVPRLPPAFPSQRSASHRTAPESNARTPLPGTNCTGPVAFPI